MATIRALRKAGWKATNENAGIPGASGYWKLTNPLGVPFEVDFSSCERAQWICSYKDGREGFNDSALHHVLETLLVCFTKRPENLL